MEENLNWLKKEYINRSHICFLLYGKKDKPTTSKFHQKLNGKYGHTKQGFTPSELEKLEQIRQQIKSEL